MLCPPISGRLTSPKTGKNHHFSKERWKSGYLLFAAHPTRTSCSPAAIHHSGTGYWSLIPENLSHVPFDPHLNYFFVMAFLIRHLIFLLSYFLFAIPYPLFPIPLYNPPSLINSGERMPSSRPTFRERLNYRFDSLMSKGTLALIGGLFLISLTIILMAAAIVSIGGLLTAPAGSTQPMSFGEAAWESLMRTLDSGTMGGDTGWIFRGIMLFVTLGGIFVVSTLIGVLSNGIEDQMEPAAQGPLARPRERSHRHPGLVAAGLYHHLRTGAGQRESQERRASSRSWPSRTRSRWRMRSASASVIRRIPRSSAALAAPSTPPTLRSSARTAPVPSSCCLPACQEARTPIRMSSRSVLALTNNPNRRAEPYHIVTQIRDPKNLEVLQHGRPEGSGAARPDQRSHCARRRADLAPIRPFGGLHRAAELRRR